MGRHPGRWRVARDLACYGMESLNQLRTFLETFPSNRMLVLGDVILDRYWWGECDRLSPEAPVPIVRKQRSTVRPGGAANTAANLVALGAVVAVAGVVGADGPAAELRNEIKASAFPHSWWKIRRGPPPVRLASWRCIN